MSEESALKDFFISYTGADRAWAEWIGWELEAAGYTVVLQAWDFALGTDFVGQMDRASQQTHRTLVVLSPRYLAARFTQPEWHAAFRRDPMGEQGLLLPVRIEDCGPDFGGLLANLAWLDLVGLEMEAARERLLAGVRQGRGKPLQAPAYPGGVPHTLSPPQRYPATRPAYWRVPFDRNPLFTGREDVLSALEQALSSSGHAALTQALTGLGGIGKTQTALEYAYRYSHRYQAVLWVQAETPALLPNEFATLAEVLGLPEAQAVEQEQAVAAVQRWLATEVDWLLVLDNVEAEEFEQVRVFLPARRGGHILFTTRAQAVSALAQPVPLALPSPEEACRFLLRRAGLAAAGAAETDPAPADWAETQALVEVLGALPLALDQAGAYIEATVCRLSDYRALLQTHQTQLLGQRGQHASHPEPVTLTWRLAFSRLQQTTPAAVALLRLCAYLAPEGIPEELFTVGAKDLPPLLRRAIRDPLAWQEVLKALQRYSLLERQPEMRTFSVHRLVQIALREDLGKMAARRWAERAVRVVSRAFPDVEFANWGQCQRLLPQVLLCASHVKTWDFLFEEASDLLIGAGLYLYQRGAYPEALPLYEQARTISERGLGPDHPAVAISLGNLATLYQAQGGYAQAQPLAQRVLAILEQTLGPNHLDVATALNNLAMIYKAQGRSAEALLLAQRALAIREQELGPIHTRTATSLNNLAGLYQDLGKDAQVLPLYERALAMREQALGPGHPDVAQSLSNLATFYHAQRQFTHALPLAQQGLAIAEQALGPDHPDVAWHLSHLATLYRAQGHATEALPLAQRALAIREQALGPTHPDVAASLNALSDLYYAQEQYSEALPLAQRALAIREQALGPDHLNVAASLNDLAEIYRAQGHATEALPLAQRALAIREQALGPDHPDVAISLNTLAGLYYAQRQYLEVLPLLQRALAIDEYTYGPDHLRVATDLEHWASLLRALGQPTQAKTLEARAQTIRVKQAQTY